MSRRRRSWGAGGAPARLALVSREVHPFQDGGIGTYVTALAQTLAEASHEVAVFTTAESRASFEALAGTGDARLPASVRWVFVDPPAEDEVGTYYGLLHLWSARVWDALREHYGDRGPDLIEFGDYLTDGAVTIQARVARVPALAQTRVCLRLHTSAEMCSVLDGHVAQDFATEQTFALERYALRHADRLLYGGGDILGAYQRFYGADALAPAVVARHPVAGLAFSAAPPPDDGPLRLLCLGRLERRKGVARLVHAVTGLAGEAWSLTIVGADTDTAPLGTSVRDTLERMAAGDPRISVRDPVPREAVTELIEQHHVTVVPSLWECWPGTALESLLGNRPVLGTPVGGLTEIIRPGESGWFSADDSPEALAGAVELLTADRDSADRLIAAGAPRSAGLRLTDPEHVLTAYESLLVERDRRLGPSRAARPPLVSVVIPYFELHEYLEEAVRSALAQTHPGVEVLIVNDGSFREADAIITDLEQQPGVEILTQSNSGLGAARNFGIGQTRGDYVLPLDADNSLEPQFVECCLRALEAYPDAAYATSWIRYVAAGDDPSQETADGDQPIGNWPRIVERGNVAGDATALIPRWVFDRGFSYSQGLASFEDWAFYRDLHRAGLFGHVVPQRLLRYRVRGESMLREFGLSRTARLEGELTAHAREAETKWTSART